MHQFSPGFYASSKRHPCIVLARYFLLDHTLFPYPHGRLPLHANACNSHYLVTSLSPSLPSLPGSKPFFPPPTRSRSHDSAIQPQVRLTYPNNYRAQYHSRRPDSSTTNTWSQPIKFNPSGDTNQVTRLTSKTVPGSIMSTISCSLALAQRLTPTIPTKYSNMIEHRKYPLPFLARSNVPCHRLAKHTDPFLETRSLAKYGSSPHLC